jgi:hypothetical protein
VLGKRGTAILVFAWSVAERFGMYVFLLSLLETRVILIILKCVAPSDKLMILDECTPPTNFFFGKTVDHPSYLSHKSDELAPRVHHKCAFTLLSFLFFPLLNCN